MQDQNQVPNQLPDGKSMADILAENGVELPTVNQDSFASSLDATMASLEAEANAAEELLQQQHANPTVAVMESTTEVVNKNQFADIEREIVIQPSAPAVTMAEAIATPVQAVDTSTQETTANAVVPATAPPVELNSIRIVKSKDNLYEMNKKKRMNARPSYQVVLPQSRYSASLTGLSTLEVNSIVAGKSDAYTNTNNTYSLIHEKMVDTSIGKVSYADFLRMTSSLEEDILLFGLYCATYPTITEIPLNCDHCEKQFTFKTLNEDILLMEPEDRDEIIRGIQAIVNLNYTNAKQVLENSEVNTCERIVLPDSGIIVDVRVPSLYNKLEDVMKKIDEKLAEKRMECIEMSVYVENIYVPDVEYDGFIHVEKYEDILDEIFLLSPRDFNAFTQAVENKVSKLKLKFGLSNVECTNCGHKFEEPIELDIRQILFLRHRHSMTNSKTNESTTNS